MRLVIVQKNTATALCAGSSRRYMREAVQWFLPSLWLPMTILTASLHPPLQILRISRFFPLLDLVPHIAATPWRMRPIVIPVKRPDRDLDLIQ
jgi:hypothetical protein